MAFGTEGRLWSDETIPYEIDAADFPVGSAQRAVIDRAIDIWNSSTIIRLVSRSGERNYVVFEDTGTKCESWIGMIGGRQVITCDLEGGFTLGSVVHEIGHAIGFFHEHQRRDRDTFVMVSDSTTDKTNCAIKKDGRRLTDYDCESVMHYGPGGCGGITATRGGCGAFGSRSRLTGRDVWGAAVLYRAAFGKTVVVWEDDSNDNGLLEVRAAGLAQTGRTYFGPLTVNPRSANQQRMPEVSIGVFGQSVFVWADDTDGNGAYQVLMRGFTGGRESISTRAVNTVATGQQLHPHVVCTAGSRIIVVWQDDSDRPGNYRIKARAFGSVGNEHFAQKTISTGTTRQSRPRVAADQNGAFVVVWESDLDGNGKSDIRMAGFHSDGTLRWGEKRVHRVFEGNYRRPQIAMGPTGEFAVVWEEDTDGNGVFNIRLRGFDANGTEIFSERRVNGSAAGQQLEPDVAIHHDAFSFSSWVVVVWADDQDRNGLFQIKMRGFNSDGAEKLAETTVNTDAAGQQRWPRIGMDRNGAFTVAWVDDPDSDGRSNILARGFYFDGRERYATRAVSALGVRASKPSVTHQALWTT